MIRTNFSQKSFGIILLILIVLFISACSTITPYQLDIANESKSYKTLSKVDAVNLIKELMSQSFREGKARISTRYADSGYFYIDDEGFSFQKTTKGERTVWKDFKTPVKQKYTNVATYNVPWKSITEIKPYLETYDAAILGEAYRVTIDFQTSRIMGSARMPEGHEFGFNCDNYQVLIDLTAALRVLTGK